MHRSFADELDSLRPSVFMTKAQISASEWMAKFRDAGGLCYSRQQRAVEAVTSER